eukprot:6161_1
MNEQLYVYDEVELYVNERTPTLSESSNDNSSNNDETFDINIECRLNNSKDEILVYRNSRPKIHDNSCVSCFKYRREYMMRYRKKRFHIVLCPVYVIFIAFCMFIISSINDRTNTNTARSIYFKTKVQNESNFQHKIPECDRWGKVNYDYITNWYDANTGFSNHTLFDLSTHSNDILIDNNIQMGLESNFRYLYGSTTQHIHIPNIISLGNNYFTSIYYVARYNGDNKGSILSDNSSA